MFEILSNRFYFKLRTFSRFGKSVFQSISIFTFKTTDKKLVLKLVLQALSSVFVSIVFLAVLFNLPIYLLQILPTSTITLSFVSNYLRIFELIILSLNFYTLTGPVSRFTIYFYMFFLLSIWKLFNVKLFLKYNLSNLQGKDATQTFDEFKITNDTNSYNNKNVVYNFTKESKIYKNIYLFCRFILIISSNFRLLFNYFLIITKKIKLYFTRYVTFGLKNYLNIILPNKIVLWRPIFKRLSYFGLFRAYRSKWLGQN